MSATPAIADTEQIVAGLRVILAPGGVTELRVLDAIVGSDRRAMTYSGYFDDAAKLAAAAATIKSAKGTYFVPNQINPALLARAENRIRAAMKEPTTVDRDITRRLWLLVDCDAVRPSGISASDAEHEAARVKAIAVCKALAADGWPWPIIADSGNGAHLMYRVDLPAAEDGLVKRCLEALATRFDDDVVSIDATVHNPARLWKLYGTLACKGDNTTDRPHRMAKIIKSPTPIELVTTEQLDGSPRVRRTSDVPERKSDGRSTINGMIGAACKHNSCAGKGWRELRELESRAAIRIGSRRRMTSARE